MRFSELAKILNGNIKVNEDTHIRYFSTDTRTLIGRNDEVFIAVNANRDGHDFVPEAIQAGVKNFIVQREVPALVGHNFFVVEHSVLAFQKIAEQHRNQFTIPIIGITGSNGKTTVKEWLSTLLSEKYFVIKNPKSFNSQIGVPISILEIGVNHDIGIFEAGVSKVNEMEFLGQVMKPTMGIFTTLGEAHNEGFESMGQKLDEKLKLFLHSEKVIHRSDCVYSDQISDKLKDKSITWSLDHSGEFKVAWSAGQVMIDGLSYQTNFSNHTELENVTHAIIAAIISGVSPEQIQKGLVLLNALPMRLELKKGINSCYILDDSYNNDLVGLRIALDYLESHQENEQKTLILSEILQSGHQEVALYQTVNELLNEKGISRLIGVGTKMKASRQVFDLNTMFFDSTDDLLENLPDFESEMILVKGARNFKLEQVVKRLEERIHGTVLEVNFEALQHNLNQYRTLLKPSTKVMVMVKANAYGSGILEVANFLQHQRVDQLGVAYVDEAISLRKNGVALPIMIMNPFIDSFREFEKYDLQAEIFSLNHLNRLLQDTKGQILIHVKIDTGMHRLGFDPVDLKGLMKVLKENERIKVAGIFTHFSSSDSEKDDQFTISQAEKFDKAYDTLIHSLGYSPTKHACNSPAVARWPQYHYDMIRLGIGLHGFDPTDRLRLRTVSKLKTTISQIQYIKKGEAVGYSRKGILNRDSHIAVLPIGYEDGYSRIFGNGNAKVMMDDKMCSTVGNVCMDMAMIDVTNTNAKEGDDVIIFGENPTIKDLAKWSNTIPYEILTNVSSRVKRVFIWE